LLEKTEFTKHFSKKETPGILLHTENRSKVKGSPVANQAGTEGR
jgi:hypothetical protein